MFILLLASHNVHSFIQTYPFPDASYSFSLLQYIVPIYLSFFNTVYVFFSDSSHLLYW